MRQKDWIDLHLHSTFSDGLRTPEQLVDLAVARGLAAISLTDHDCLDGYPDLLTAANEHGIEVITGVELSSIYGGKDLHILGYGVGVDDASFQGMLARFRKTREERGLKILCKLGEIGVHLDADRVLENAGDGALGRPHIAEALLEGGFAKDFNEVFDKYIGEHCPAYVEKYKITPREAIDHIHASGGLAFVAHPGYYLENLDEFNELVSEGFDGIEVFHPNHTKNVIAVLSGVTKDRGLLESGGSDFHGFEGRNNLGEHQVPYELLERIKDRLKAD